MEPERILVVCAASNTALGRAIRKLTGSPVNHCHLLYQSRLWGGWWAAQIGKEGVQKLPANKVMREYALTECYEYVHDLSPGLRACRGMIGQRYDYLGIAGFMVKLAAWWIARKKIKNPWHHQNAEFCSEFVARVLGANGIAGFDEDDPASLSPGDVRTLIRDNPQFCQVTWP